MRLRLVERAAQLQASGAVHLRSPMTLDEFLDGIEIPSGVRAQNWSLEHEVHGSALLSKAVESTRNLLSTQVNLVRDDVRDKTWCSIIEGGKLTLVEIGNEGSHRCVLTEANVWRSHMVLDKFAGEPIVCWITATSESHTLWFQNEAVPTAARRPDFPFTALSQAPIGHAQSDPPAFGVLAYKCRDTGQLFCRRFEGARLGPEIEVDTPAIVGGLSFAISGEEIIGRIDAIKDDRVVPMISFATDAGAVFGDFEAVELPYGASFHALPASAPPATDFLGFFHVPIAVANGEESIALDLVVNEALVEAVRMPTSASGTPEAGTQAFPKKTATTESDAPQRFGDGVTDGLGIIMVALSEGRLFTSNSQAGGIHFPERVHLNHEMPKVAAFNATECYTGGKQPNVVSMDYVYLEADAEGFPLSGELHFETWHMPLPEPQARARADGSDVIVTIDKDANFIPGETIFELDPSITVRSVEVIDDRNARVVTDAGALTGRRIGFEVRSRFYHHRGSAVIT